MTAIASDQIARERGHSLDALWADYDLVWTQYQSWRDHDRLMAESQDRLDAKAPDLADDLKRLLGETVDLELAGQQLLQALNHLATELEAQRSQLSLDRQKQLDNRTTLLDRERELRAMRRGPDHERER